MSRPCQRIPGLGQKSLKGHQSRSPSGWNRAADVDAQERMPPQVNDSPIQPLRIQAAVRQNDDCPIPWHPHFELRQQSGVAQILVLVAFPLQESVCAIVRNVHHACQTAATAILAVAQQEADVHRQGATGDTGTGDLPDH